jgi:DNA-binding transcriptional ArsR family regulator
MYELLFGNAVAARSLMYLVNYGQGHINGVAKTFGLSPSQVERQLKKLEGAGILVSSMLGNVRVFQINPRLAIKKELIALMEKILLQLPEAETNRYFRQRTRPRRSGKAL